MASSDQRLSQRHLSKLHVAFTLGDKRVPSGPSCTRHRLPDRSDHKVRHPERRLESTVDLKLKVRETCLNRLEPELALGEALASAASTVLVAIRQRALKDSRDAGRRETLRAEACMNHIERYSIFAALRCFIAILCRVIWQSDSFGAKSLNTKPTRIEPGESCFVN